MEGRNKNQNTRIALKRRSNHLCHKQLEQMRPEGCRFSHTVVTRALVRVRERLGREGTEALSQEGLPLTIEEAKKNGGQLEGVKDVRGGCFNREAGGLHACREGASRWRAHRSQ